MISLRSLIIVDFLGHDDTRSSHTPYRFINYETQWCLINPAAHISRFLQKQLTLQEESAALLADYNQHSSIKSEADLLLSLIFYTELKSACESVWVWGLGAVRDHSVHEPNWSALRGSSSQQPKVRVDQIGSEWSHWVIGLVLRGKSLPGADRITKCEQTISIFRCNCVI